MVEGPCIGSGMIDQPKGIIHWKGAHSGVSKSGTLLPELYNTSKSFPMDLRILTLRLGRRPIKTITKFKALFDGKAEARSIRTTPSFGNTQVQGIVLTGSRAMGQSGQTNESNTTMGQRHLLLPMIFCTLQPYPVTVPTQLVHLSGKLSVCIHLSCLKHFTRNIPYFALMEAVFNGQPRRL